MTGQYKEGYALEAAAAVMGGWMKIHVLDDYFDTLRHLPSFDKLDGHEVTVWTDHENNVEKLAARLKDAEVLALFRERTSIGADLVARLPHLKLVSQRGVYPHVDVEALTKAGVLLCSAKGKSWHSTAAAELAFALILAAARQLDAQIASVRAGTWQAGVGRSVNGMTIGLYGYGELGQIVAGYAKAFGMKVVWWASEAGRARAVTDGETVAQSREEFFAETDVISLHIRLVEATRGIVTSEDLARMKERAILVNTSRAGLIEPGALLTALDAGRPGQAALDVFEDEPVRDPTRSLVSHPKVIPTPHIGFVTEDELDHQFSDIYDQIIAFEANDPINAINHEALGEE